MVGFAGGHSGHTRATLDPVSSTGRLWTHDRDAQAPANYCYKKYKAYQPDGVLARRPHSEFNVNAGYEQLRVLKESLEHLPSGVSKVMMRSDSAGYRLCRREG